MIPDNSVHIKIQRLFTRLKQNFERSWLNINPTGKPDLVSLALIGRGLRSRRIDQVMDFDIVIILNGSMSRAKYTEVDRIVSSLQDESKADIYISYQIADGPIKPLPAKGVNLFFHIILHTVRSYRSSPLILVKNSWQYEAQRLLGLELSDIQRIPEPSLRELLDGKLGIKHCKELVRSGSSTCLEWLAGNTNSLTIHLTPLKFSEIYEVLEICYYSVLRGASNALRYILGHSLDIGIGYEDMRMFFEVFQSFRYRNLPLSFWEEKIKLRQGTWYPKHQDLRKRIEQALEFLSVLEIDIPNRKRLGSPYPQREYFVRRKVQKPYLPQPKYPPTNKLRQIRSF